MIMDAIFSIINSLINLVPDAHAVTVLDWSGLGPVLSTMNYYFPINEFFLLCISYMLLIKGKLIVRLVRWTLELL